MAKIHHLYPRDISPPSETVRKSVRCPDQVPDCTKEIIQNNKLATPQSAIAIGISF
jgi:hypothetical protein